MPCLCYYTSEMSCPYFYPTESRGGSALLPLGDSWAGHCHADPAQPATPDDALCCNLGYARGHCARFPDTAGPDAVRFTIAREDAAGVALYYVIERDHIPLRMARSSIRTRTGFRLRPTRC